MLAPIALSADVELALSEGVCSVPPTTRVHDSSFWQGQGTKPLSSLRAFVGGPQSRIERDIVEGDGPAPNVSRNETNADVGGTGGPNRQARAQDDCSIRLRT